MTHKSIQVPRLLRKTLNKYTYFSENYSKYFRESIIFLNKILRQYEPLINGAKDIHYDIMNFSLVDESDRIINIIKKWTENKKIFHNSSEFGRVALLLHFIITMNPEPFIKINGIKDIIISEQYKKKKTHKKDKKISIKPKKFYSFYKFNFYYNHVVSIFYEVENRYYTILEMADIMKLTYANTLVILRNITEKDAETFIFTTRKPKRYKLNKDYITEKIKELKNVN